MRSFGILLAALILAGTLGGQALAQMAPAPFALATPGTEFTWKNVLEPGTTSLVEVGQAEGYKAIWTTNGEDRDGYLMCSNCSGRAPVDEQDYARLWPLEVGKRIEFLRSRGNRSWRNSIEVIGTETLTLGDIGPVETYVVVNESSRIGGSWKGKQTIHFAPSLGWTVKFDYSDTDGEKSAWEMIAHKPVQ